MYIYAYWAFAVAGERKTRLDSLLLGVAEMSQLDTYSLPVDVRRALLAANVINIMIIVLGRVVS